MLPIGNIYLRRPSFSLTPLLTYLSLAPRLRGISIAQRTAFRRYSESISPLMNRWGVFPSLSPSAPGTATCPPKPTTEGKGQATGPLGRGTRRVSAGLGLDFLAEAQGVGHTGGHSAASRLRSGRFFRRCG